MADSVADAGGTTVSFSNTPQAKDDIFSFTEIEALAGTGIRLLTVLANDSGGAAKSLYSLDDGESDPVTGLKRYAPEDLLMKDGLGVVQYSALGAKIWITADGKIAYDANSIADTLNALAAGEPLTDTITYAIQLGNGTLSWATTTINIIGANDAPTDIDLDNSSVAENAAGAVVGTLTTTDVDGGATHTYTVNDDRFEVTPEGVLKLKDDVALDYEDEQSITIEVTTTDEHGASFTEEFVIDITDVNEQPTLTVDATPVSFAEDTAAGTALADVDGTDPDTLADTDDPAANDTFNDLTYTIVSVDTATSGAVYDLFAIDGTNGNISLAAGQSFDYETDQSYSLVVRVTDGPGLFDEKTVVVNITDVNENSPPTAADDVWVLSDTVIPTGIITPIWFTNNDTDPDSDPLFVTAVAGLTADGVIGSTGLTANFEVIGGLNQLVDISGLAVTGSYTLSYTLSDGSATDTNNTVSLTVVNTTDTGNTITLTNNDFSYIDGQSGGDNITGPGVVLDGNAGVDTFLGGNGNDTLSGGAGADKLFGNENNDTLNGGDGNDTLDGGNGTDTITGGNGNDVIYGGDNDISLDGGADTDTLVVIGDFNDGVNAQIANIENVLLSETAGLDLILEAQNEGFNITGSSFGDFIQGGSGNDTINGGSGNDTIRGGAGQDTMTGGGVGDADQFVFDAIGDSTTNTATADRITDFELAVTNELINLSAIDANGSAGGNGAFTVVAANAGFVDGQITYSHASGDTVVRVDVANSTDQMLFVLTGIHSLTTNDFIL